jgi:hypothetical protein
MDSNFIQVGKYAVNPALISAIDFSHEDSATVLIGHNAVTVEGDEAATLRKQYWKEEPAKPARHGEAAEGDTGNPAQTSSRYGATPQTQKK